MNRSPFLFWELIPQETKSDIRKIINFSKSWKPNIEYSLESHVVLNEAMWFQLCWMMATTHRRRRRTNRNAEGFFPQTEVNLSDDRSPLLTGSRTSVWRWPNGETARVPLSEWTRQSIHHSKPLLQWKELWTAWRWRPHGNRQQETTMICCSE